MGFFTVIAQNVASLFIADTITETVSGESALEKIGITNPVSDAIDNAKQKAIALAVIAGVGATAYFVLKKKR